MNFDRQEYGDRLARVRAAMDRRGIEVLVVSDPSNMAWLTGYDGWSFYVHQAVVLGLTGDPVWWGRGMDANGARRTVWMGAGCIHGYDDSYVQNPDKHPMADLARVMAGHGLRGRVAVELDNYYYSAAAHQALTAALGAAPQDATGLVNWQRLVKSPAELDRMRAAGRIVTAMHATIRETAEPGMRKCDLVAEIYRTALRGVEGAWGDYPAIVPMAPSGLDATAPHLTWDDRPLARGEATFFEIAGVCRRYHAPQSRTLFLGKPPEKYARAEDAVRQAVAAGLALARPGHVAGEIAEAFNATLNRLGFEKDSRCGYAIGLSYPPDWGERTVSFRRGDATVLQPGMCFHFMPALWLDDGGIETTEPILITEGAPEMLAHSPDGLFIKD